MSVGDVLDLSAGANTRRVVSPTAVVVSGTFEPLDPADEVWAAEPRMLGIAKILTPQGGTTDQAAVIAPLESYSVVGDGLWRGPVEEPPPSPSPAFDHTWRYTLDADRLTRDDVEVLRDFLVRLDTDPTTWTGVPNVPAVSTGLGGLLDRYERDVAVTGVLTSFVTGGVTALAVLVLALTALLGAQRRDREVRLLRARGASRAQVLTLVGVATSVLAVPLAAVAALAVVLLVPGDTTGRPGSRSPSWSCCRRWSRSSRRPGGCAPSTRSPRSRRAPCGPPGASCSRPPSCSSPCSRSRPCAAAARSSPPGAPTGTRPSPRCSSRWPPPWSPCGSCRGRCPGSPGSPSAAAGWSRSSGSPGPPEPARARPYRSPPSSSARPW